MDWIGWIKGCLQPTLVSILVNGSPTTKFNTQKGLRQDNPLAPFLFLMVVESLIGLIRQAMVANKFYGVKVGKDLMVSMLQFYLLPCFGVIHMFSVDTYDHVI